MGRFNPNPPCVRPCTKSLHDDIHRQCFMDRGLADNNFIKVVKTTGNSSQFLKHSHMLYSISWKSIGHLQFR